MRGGAAAGGGGTIMMIVGYRAGCAREAVGRLIFKNDDPFVRRKPEWHAKTIRASDKCGDKGDAR